METKKKIGRPKFQIDYVAVEKLASIMATQEEIATFLGCAVRTLQNDDEFMRVFKKGQENGKMSLRRTQWKLAERNVSMAIWLGKQYLGQRDVHTLEHQELSKVDKLLAGIEKIDD